MAEIVDQDGYDMPSSRAAAAPVTPVEGIGYEEPEVMGGFSYQASAVYAVPSLGSATHLRSSSRLPQDLDGYVDDSTVRAFILTTDGTSTVYAVPMEEDGVSMLPARAAEGDSSSYTVSSAQDASNQGYAEPDNARYNSVLTTAARTRDGARQQHQAKGPGHHHTRLPRDRDGYVLDQTLQENRGSNASNEYAVPAEGTVRVFR
jgi:hypothetical protein